MKAIIYLTSGAKEPPQRWQLCVQYAEVFFGRTISRKFVAQHFDERSKEAATKMIKRIKIAFKNSFHQVDWMDEVAKKAAEEKVDLMGESIGYPDDIDDIEKEDKHFSAVVCSHQLHLAASRDVERRFFGISQKSLGNDTLLKNVFTLAHSNWLEMSRQIRGESPHTCVNLFVYRQ